MTGYLSQEPYAFKSARLLLHSALRTPGGSAVNAFAIATVCLSLLCAGCSQSGGLVADDAEAVEMVVDGEQAVADAQAQLGAQPPAAVAEPAVAEPAVAPAPEPVAEAAPEPVAEAAPEPIAEAAPEPVAEPLPTGPLPGDGDVFTMSGLLFEYGMNPPHPDLPMVDDLMDIEVDLGLTDEGYVAPRLGLDIQTVRLGDIPAGAQHQFYASAILWINRSVVRYFNQTVGVVGVYVIPHPEDIFELADGDRVTLLDEREGRTTLREIIRVGVITEVRTIASGKRIDMDRRVNASKHKWLISKSPVQASTYTAVVRPASDFVAGSLVRRTETTVDGKKYNIIVGALSGSATDDADGVLIEVTEARGDQEDVPVDLPLPAAKPVEPAKVIHCYVYPAMHWKEMDARQHAYENNTAIDDPGTARIDLLDKAALDEYVLKLSRHPGRTVEVALAAASDIPGEVSMDFLVTENRPWLAYYQIANTGTKTTSDWRHRFGFVANQLTGNDDILTADYITAFDNSEVALLSYEAPLGLDWLRGRARGSWNKFTAGDVGRTDEALTGDNYKGDGWMVGADFIVNLGQWDETFLDAIIGAEFRSIYVDNTVTSPLQKERSEFFLPSVGLLLERTGETSASRVAANVEWTLDSVAGDTNVAMERLGREKPANNWTVLKWNASTQFWLEPLLSGERWKDPQSKWATLAHEMQFSFSGQLDSDDRLIPHAQQTAGGLHTVRGYPESVIAGDTVLIARAEYGFHLPKVLKPGGKKGSFDVLGQEFRMTPQYHYGQADWDLVFKVFYDIGRTINTKTPGVTFERDDTIMGAGVGAELSVKQHVSVRVDWGVALRDLDEEGVDAGDSEVHFVATLVY